MPGRAHTVTATPYQVSCHRYKPQYVPARRTRRRNNCLMFVQSGNIRNRFVQPRSSIPPAGGGSYGIPMRRGGRLAGFPMPRRRISLPAPHPPGANMLDFVFLAAGLLFFGLCLAGAALCDRL